MSARSHDHLLHALWRKGDRIYKTVGIIYDPAVVIEDVVTGEHETHVIGCLIYNEYERLITVDALEKMRSL